MSISSVSSTSTTTTATQSTAHAKAVAARAFAETLGGLNQQLDQFEHQATWRVDHHQAVTLPTGVSTGSSTSNSSDGATNSSATATGNSSSGATAPSTSKVIAESFADLEATAESKLSDLTPDEQAQVTALNTKLTAETARFQGFINRRASTAAKADKYADTQAGRVDEQVSDFEHQVTWQIDHGQTVTGPKALDSTASTTDTAGTSTQESTTAATSSDSSTTGTNTAASLSATIADGFAAIESEAASRLKYVPSQLQTQFQAFQKNLTTEETRFNTFAVRREAYRAANPKAQKDVTA